MPNTDFQAFNQGLHHLCFWLIYTVHTFKACLHISILLHLIPISQAKYEEIRVGLRLLDSIVYAFKIVNKAFCLKTLKNK